jgi:simple sugar transport system permease protein
MSTPVKTAPPTPAEASNRVQVSWTTRLLGRPEVGALVAAIVIFIFFLIVAPAFRTPAAFFTVLYQASTIGIVAVGVGMLMIGGEFDLSAGVLVTSAGLVNGMLCYQLGLNLWVGVIISLVFCLGVGFLNGYLVMRTGIPSFLITLGMFFVLQGANLGVTKLVTGSVSSQNISQMDGFKSLNFIFAHEFKIGSVSLSITVIWWLMFVILSAWIWQRTKIGYWIFSVCC